MYGSASVSNDSDRTAFRKAEKKYKLYYEDTSKSSKKYVDSMFVLEFPLKQDIYFANSCLRILNIPFRKKQPKRVDLSEVLDFKSFLKSHIENGDLLPGIAPLQSDLDSPVFCLESHPGIIFLRSINYCFVKQVM